MSQELLGSHRIVPEIRMARLFLKSCQFGAFCISVKDTSEVLMSVPLVPYILL
jgi:hypothetical protein